MAKKFKKGTKGAQKAVKEVEQPVVEEAEELNDSYLERMAKPTDPNRTKDNRKIERVIIDEEDLLEEMETDEEEEVPQKNNKAQKKALQKKAAPQQPPKKAVEESDEDDSEDEDEEEDGGYDEEDVEGEEDLMDDEELEEEADDEEEEGDDEEEEEEAMETSTKHKKDLLKLKESDPEFFKFMQEQDADLLDFQESEGEDEDEAGDEEEEEEEEGEEESAKSRIPKARKDGSGRLVFDGNQYDYLESFLDPEDESQLKKKPAIGDVVFAVDAFHACVSRVGADMEPPRYIINEQAIFEATVRLCFQNLGDLFKRLVKYELESGDKEAKGKHRSKQFKKYQPHIKQYLTAVVMFLNEVQTDAVIISTLKAIHQMLELYASMTKIARNLIKTLVRIWTRKTLNCRIMAFVCMNQLLKTHPEYLSNMYKSCYLGFVSNSREVTAETWPLLQFMHRTFAELTLLAPESAYPYAFVYIRQTAIHLRNAIISKKRKDLVQTIYNWQLVQCLYLWVRVVSKAHSVNGAESICELSYPLTQIIIGVMQLYPSLRYLPLRFHCISMLIQLQASCTTYVPVLALGSELLSNLSAIMSKKPSPCNAKTGDMDSYIKVSFQTLDDPTWRVAAGEHLFKLLLQASHIMCSQPAFPDLIRPAIYNIRAFIKSARNPDHVRLFKGLQDKLNEHAKFVSDTLQLRELNLGDEMSVRAAKFVLNTPDSPLRLFYRQWEKVWKMKQEVAARNDKKTVNDKKAAKGKKAAEEEEMDVKPVIEKKQKKKKRVTTPAAKTADASLPDSVADLGEWSD